MSNLKFWLAAVVIGLLLTATLEMLQIIKVQQQEDYPFENHSEITQETLNGK